MDHLSTQTPADRREAFLTWLRRSVVAQQVVLSITARKVTCASRDPQVLAFLKTRAASEGLTVLNAPGCIVLRF